MADNSQKKTTDGFLSKLRLTRLQSIEVAILGIIITVAILIRILPLQYGAMFTAFDPLFQYRATEYVVENGYTAWWDWHDTMSWYPMGRDISLNSYPGLPFTAAFFYGIVKYLAS